MHHQANKELDKLSWLQWLQWATLFVGLIASVVLHALANDKNNRETQAQFLTNSKNALFHIEQQLLGYTEVLRGIQSHFVSTPDLPPHKFKQVYAALAADERLPAIQAIGFSRRVRLASMPSESTRSHAVRWPANALTHPNGLLPAAADGYQITYAEPLRHNRSGIGFDQYSESARRSAIEQARDTGEIAATGTVVLRAPDSGENGVVLFMPVYAGGIPPGTVERRRTSIIGVVFLAIRIDEAFTRALTEPSFERLGLQLVLTPSQHASSLAEHRPTLLFSNKAADVRNSNKESESLLKAVHTLSFNRGIWQAEFSAPRAAYPPSNRWMPAIATSSALLGTLALFLVVRQFRFISHRSHRQHQSTSMALQLRERAIEASANAIIVCRAQAPDYPVEYVNPAFERMTGYSAHEILGKNLRILHRADRDQKGLEEIRAIVRENREGHAKLRNYRKDGSMFWTDIRIAPVTNISGEVTHFVAAKYDITDTKKYEEELEFQANHDALTGLPNRSLLQDRLKQSIAHAKRINERFWVAFLDLDRFKYVNDTMGHSAGDQLLQQVTSRLRLVLRETDTIARHGGDEFVLLIGAEDTGMPGTAIVQRVMEALAQPIEICNQFFFITSSIGIATYPTDGEDAETLIKNADIAMYRAKELGRNNFQFYSPALNAKALDRLKLEKDLRIAIERNEFELHYQPQQAITDGQITGFEALIRWNHPLHGTIAPERFIALAEETGLIVPIGYWVIRSACLQNREWHNAGLHQARVAVNVSARQFSEKNFVSTIVEILEATNLPPCYLELELTEGMVMENTEHTINVLSQLKEVGVTISIDDFGTGYSSLAYLKRFPLDMLKIDRSFVRDIAIDNDDRSIVNAVISLAHSLHLTVIAEGVEDEAQLQYLRQQHCDFVQGYYISKPMPPSLIDDFVKSRAV